MTLNDYAMTNVPFWLIRNHKQVSVALLNALVYSFPDVLLAAWVGTAMILISGVLLFFHPGGVQYERTTAMMYMGQPIGQQTMMAGQPAVMYQQQQAQQLPMKQMHPQLGGQAYSQACSQAYSNPSQAYSAGYNSGYR